MKQKAPLVAANNKQGHQTQAIAHVGLDTFIVSLSPEKDKALHDVSQLRSSMQEVRQESKWFPALSLR
jgi:hypothetical protein